MYLVEGDNGQLGIAVFNYLMITYDLINTADIGPQSINELIFIEGSLKNKVGNTVVTVRYSEDSYDDFGYYYLTYVMLYCEWGSGDYYMLDATGHLGPFDD